MNKTIMSLLWEAENVTPKQTSIGMAGFPTVNKTPYEKLSELINVTEDAFNHVISNPSSREEKCAFLLSQQDLFKSERVILCTQLNY